MALFRSLCLVLSLLKLHHAFVMNTPMTTTTRSTSRLFLEKWVAKLIDGELDREQHKADYEREWMEKNRAAVIQTLNSENNLMLDDDAMQTLRQRKKDEYMAKQDPQSYCADRCIATGNCDVFEDFLELSALEVMEFCSDCVLSESDEPCDLPEAFFNEDPVETKPKSKLSP